MFLRLLFTLLVALNIAVGAWLLWGQDGSYSRSATDPGVPALHLLAEQTGESDAAVAAANQAAAEPTTRAGAADTPAGGSYSCMALGPFASPQDLRNARARLAGPGIRMRSRQEQTTQSHGWWVYLPATARRSDALEQARRLSAAGINDYFVVSSGDQPNTISLGLFRDPDNARNRRDQLLAAGFQAQLSERTETIPQYWLDLTVSGDRTLHWRDLIADPRVGSHSSSCF